MIQPGASHRRSSRNFRGLNRALHAAFSLFCCAGLCTWRIYLCANGNYHHISDLKEYNMLGPSYTPWSSSRSPSTSRASRPPRRDSPSMGAVTLFSSRSSSSSQRKSSPTPPPRLCASSSPTPSERPPCSPHTTAINRLSSTFAQIII